MAANKVLEAKIAEGKKHVAEGDKAVKTGLFKWKPDWETASIEYDKAGIALFNGKAYPEAVDAYRKASNAHYKCEATFHAAGALEKAANAAVENGDFETAVTIFKEASMLYREDGKPDKAASTLIKASKNIEQQSVDEALELLLEACEIFESEDREIFAHETFKATVALYLKEKRYNEALGVMKRQKANYTKLGQKESVWKTILSLVIVQLAKGDYVAADRAQQDGMGFEGYIKSNECAAANELLAAMDERDDEKWKACVKKQVFNFLDQQVVRVARKMPAPGEGGGGGCATAGGAAEDSNDDLL